VLIDYAYVHISNMVYISCAVFALKTFQISYSARVLLVLPSLPS